MDDPTKHAWKEFLMGPGGKDLMARFISNEANYQMEGIKAEGVEGKALAMAKIEAVYTLRTGIQNIIEPSKPAGS